MLRCLNCNSALVVDPSLQQSTSHVLDGENPAEKGNAAAASSTSKSTIPERTGKGKPAAVTDAGDDERDRGTTENAYGEKEGDSFGSIAGNLGHLTVMHGNLFDIVSSNSDPLKHPLCQECTSNLLDCMDEQLASLENECAEYAKVLTEITKNAPTSNVEGFDTSMSASAELASARRELAQLQSDENALRSELERLALDEKALDEQLAHEQAEIRSIDKENEHLWQSYRDCTRKLLDLELDEQSVRNQLKYASSQLEGLSKVNIFNVAFHIWHDGQYGSINGFRLGWLPNDNIDWNEVNAAWGQAALLLASLARRIDCSFVRWYPVSMGCTSFMRQIADVGDPSSSNSSAPSTSASSATLPLYTTYGGHKFVGGSSTKFDNAMVAFMDCLNQLQIKIDDRIHGVRLPYVMLKDKIIDKDREYSVRMQLNSEERWTKAMKFLLTNMKWALAWVASLD